MLLLLALACTSADDNSGGDPPASEEAAPTVLVVSMDGFRNDYRERAYTPTFDALAAEGVWSRGFVPSFPTKTFPNHYTIATGLYPAHHGLVDNYFYDPTRQDLYEMTDEDDITDPYWYGGEPIWETVESQGLIAATHYWVGSEARPPSISLPYDGSVPYGERIDTVIGWLELPEGERPSLAMLYFDQPDSDGHEYGPESDEILETIEDMDTWLEHLVTDLDSLEIDVDLIVLSDHGMSQISEERLALVDPLVDLDDTYVLAWGPYTAMDPPEGTEDDFVAALEGIEHAWCARNEDLPDYLHYTGNERIAAVYCLADDGWSLTTSTWTSGYEGGTHGYDPSYESMHGIFLGHGPHFQEGLETETFESIETYGLIAEILGVEPAETDGDIDSVRHLLR